MATHKKHRTPGPAERLVSVAVLAVLGVALAYVLVRQRTPNPAVLVATAAAQQASQTPSGGDAPAANLLSPWPDGLQTMSAAEHFTPVTLSDKINGKAELYFSAGFVAMSCQRVALTAAPDSWMEFFIYDMGAPVNAFSVFSAQKRQQVIEVAVGDYAYQADNQLCLVHGNYYLELVATDSHEATQQAALALARTFVAGTAVESHADVSAEQSLFPTEGLIPDSITLLSADVFGFDRLQNVFVARYRDGTEEVTLFITRRDSPTAAVELAAGFRGFLINDCGGEETPSPATPSGMVMIDLGGVFEGVFTSGPFMAGVHEAPDRELAVRWTNRLADKLARSTR